MTDVVSPAHVYGTTPGLAVLGCKRKKADQAIRGKLSSMASTSVPALSSFHDGLKCGTKSWNQPFAPQVVVLTFITAVDTLPERGYNSFVNKL